MPVSTRVSLLILVLAVFIVSPAGAGPLVGDLDGNCKVDWWDLDIFVGYWLADPGGIADLNGDNKINILDFALLSNNWLEIDMQGSLQVTISPQGAIDGGARWRVDGGDWQTSSSIIHCLLVGSHTVDFSVVRGWTQPDNQIVQINDGELTVLVGTYVQQKGSIKVNLAPQAAIDSGAQWRVDGGQWQNSGTTISNLAVDWHTVELSEIMGWSKPTDRIVAINANQTTTITGTYVQPLVISEFMAINDSNLPDPEDPTKFWDWIEIYNPSDVSINLNGWYLKYQAAGGSLKEWQFPSVELDPGEFLVVFASEKDRRDPTRPLHTNFKLRGDGGYLGLLTNDGVTVAHEYAPQYPEQLANISYGLPQNATTLVATGATVSYAVPTRNDANWTAVAFNDLGWDTGKTPLSFAIILETGQDVGSPAAKGSYTLNNGVYTIKGDGADIGGSSDSFYYVYASLKGDGELTARVVSMDNTNDWAKAGVMIRETLDAGSRYAMMLVSANTAGTHGVSFQYRTTTNGSSASSSGGAMKAPYWVRIKRVGNVLSGYVSPDGNTWTQQGSNRTITMTEDVYIGLCVTSRVSGTLCTAVFDNVKVKGNNRITSNLRLKMLGINTSLWTRIKFNLAEGDADLFNTLTLRVRYEDGFVAYLNGQQVARRNAPASLLWNSTSDSNRPNEQSLIFESINITAFKSILQTGTNVLAIHALNDNKNDEDFLILPQLIAAVGSSIPEYFTKPTPGALNISGAKGLVDDVSFSHERGFYNSSFYLTLCTDEPDAVIRYTLNGSRPTAVHGTIYDPAWRPWISKTTCVRAVAFKQGYLDSKVAAHTYIFLNDVIKQSPTGQKPDSNWPGSGVNGQSINYGMDPDVVNNSQYSGQIKDALKAIPTVSLVTDLANLFNASTGIYVNAGQEGRSWERPVSVELINPDGSEGFQIDAGLRIRGGYSASGSNPKHAFRLFFRNEYGQGKLKFPLFEDEGVDEFDHVDLRCSQNYSWAFEGSPYNTDVRDVFSRDVQGQTGQPYTRSRYYHLYINGQYWGLFQTQERSEASFGASYMGGDKDDYDVVSSNWSAGRQMVPTDGNRDALDRLYDETIAGFDNYERYYRVQGLNIDGTRNYSYEKLLDVDNVIDFMIIEYYTGDRDGPGSRFGDIPNNTWGVYNRVNPDGWKWLHHDNEHTLGVPSSELNMVTYFTWAGAQREYFNPQWLHEQLMFSNIDYRLHFADHVYRHFFNNGILTLDKARNDVSNRASQIYMAVIAESARWGDSQTYYPLTQSDWLTEINRLLYTTSDYRCLTLRVGVVLQQFKDVGWYPNINPPTFNQNGGLVPEGFGLVMSNPNGPGTIYYTLDGNDPRLSMSQSSSDNTVTLVPEDAAKKVLVPSVANGGNLLSSNLPLQVTYYKANITVSTVAIAKTVISTPAYQSNVATEKALVINYYNTGGYGHFDNDSNFPGTVINTNVDDFVIQVRGSVLIPSTGYWTFGANCDDGFELKLTRGATTFTSTWPNTRSAPTDTVAAWNFTEAGIYDMNLVYFNRTGGSEIELFAAQGKFFGFNYTSFHLVGDVDNGGLQLGENNIWVTSYFNDPNWTSGTGGVGYERNPGDPVNYTALIDVNVGSAMYNKNGSCYIRIPFTANHTEFTDMTLRVRYDDGFIAYLNGTEVARRNFTGTPAWNSLASSEHSDSAAIVFEDINVSPYIKKALRQGNNLLAIHGMNFTANSSDFLISAELVAHEISEGKVSPAAIKYTGPAMLNNTTDVKARVLSGITWSPLNEAVFAIGPVAENLRITEIMYHPEDTNDPNDPNEEFIELKNSGTQTLNLNLVQFTNGIDFTFPNLELAGGQYVVVVKNRAAFNAQYPGFSGIIAGQYTGSLENAGERIRLEDALGGVILDFEYKDGWREITDGNGFSLTIINPSDPNINHWSEKDYWRASVYWGGSPGWDDSGFLPNPGAVVINEVLAHSHAGAPDWIELHNTTNSAINIGNWFLSDSGSNLKKYKIAAGTSIPQNGYKVFYENTDFNDVTDPGCLVPFALSENGEAVYLSSAEPDGVLTGYRDVEDFGASLTDVSFGRYHLGSTGNYNFVAMSAKTLNGSNAYPKVGPVVINEIMYNPDWPEGGLYSNDEYEYIELRNISGSSVTLYDSNEHLPWKFTNGIEYTFPASPAVTIPAGGYIVVVRNKTAFSWRYPAVPSGKIYGPYSGHLDNGGESLELSQPGDVDEFGERHYIRVDRVNYSDGSHPQDCPGGVDLWPVEADGLGKSLSRKVASAYGNDPNNWTAAAPSPAQ